MEADYSSAQKTETEVENRAAGEQRGEQHAGLLVNGKQITMGGHSKI